MKKHEGVDGWQPPPSIVAQRDELLALLREALELMWGNADEDAIAYRNKARAAIAKAEGGK
jgi:hypothetical protein